MSKRRPARKLTRVQRRLLGLRRRTVLLLLVAGVVGGLVLADRAGLFGRAPAGDLGTYHGQTFRVTRVVDGDTLDVDCPDATARRKTTRIRLWGVDTPETVKPHTPPQPFGPEASACTKDLCDGRRVRLELDPDSTRGRYGRLLAYVFLPDGRMLNRVLIRDGYGYADPRFRHAYRAKFHRLQDQARRAGRGLWAVVREADLPHYWRGRVKLPAP